MEKIESEIKKVCLKKYKKNLAAILIFGSYFTGNYKEKESDIDLIILLKENSPSENDKNELIEKTKHLNVSLHHLRTLENYKEKIYKEASWSSWIVCIKGAKIIYSTPEFFAFQKYLAKNPLDKDKLLKFVIEKDKFDLENDLKQKTGFKATKMLHAHIRRKLQILAYYEKNRIEPNFTNCLAVLNIKNKSPLQALNEKYIQRISISEKEIKKFVAVARKLTPIVNSKLK